MFFHPYKIKIECYSSMNIYKKPWNHARCYSLLLDNNDYLIRTKILRLDQFFICLHISMTTLNTVTINVFPLKSEEIKGYNLKGKQTISLVFKLFIIDWTDTTKKWWYLYIIIYHEIHLHTFSTHSLWRPMIIFLYPFLIISKCLALYLYIQTKFYFVRKLEYINFCLH